MTLLEEEVSPTFSSCLCNWKRNVNCTHAYIVPETVRFILYKLNSFRPNIQFTFELEKNNTIAFLDVLIKLIDISQMETRVY